MRIIRQTFVILKQNPLLSTISILGTAFAITMIMAIVITWQTKYADLEPEVNRSRCLYFSAMHVYDKEKDGNNNWSNPSAAFMKECVQPVPEVEYCTAFSPAGLSLASLTDGNNRVKVDAMRTDPDFWKVFSMQFLAGRGFSEADRAGESKAVVVCASVARKLYGSTDVVGQEFLLNREFARIVGVVKDVSVTAKDAYAQVWGMYSADELKITGVHSYLGGMQIAVLARTSDDFPAIREGIAKQVERVNAGLGNKQIDIMEQPDNIVAHVNHVWANVGPDLTMLYLQYAVALFIILLVPSLNLCGLSNSRMQQRITELGVRKAFTKTYRLGAALQNVRYHDYDQARSSYSMMVKQSFYYIGLELCVRVREGQDNDFIERLKADSESQFRIGNIFISEIRSFKDIRRNYQQAWTNDIRNYVMGMGFLLLNIFLGLLGTFWFRTQQRRSEIALHKAHGATDRAIFSRLLSEGILLLAIVTPVALLIDYNLAHLELNSWRNGTTLEWDRLLLCAAISFVLITLMIVIGIGIPARKAMKVQPAEALHDE